MYRFDDAFMTLYRLELEEYLTEQGCQVTVVDADRDQEAQFRQIDGLIADSVDVLIVNMVASYQAGVVIERAKAADIPVVFIGHVPRPEDLALWDRVCYVGVDLEQSGRFQGEIIAETANQGDWDGDGFVEYVMLLGDPSDIAPIRDTSLPIQALIDAGILVNQLYCQRADFSKDRAKELMETALRMYGEEIEVVLCESDDMALGALEAIQEAGRIVGEDIYLVGVDGTEEAMEKIKAGEMTGTVRNDYAAQARKAGDAAMLAAKGEKLETFYRIDFVKVTQENAGE